MNKLVIFDLDGVLVDSKDIHFNALNIALGKIGEKYIINREDHINIYDGLPTNKKLEILTETKQLPPSLYEDIWKDKQKTTLDLFNNIKIDEDLIKYCKLIKDNNINIAVASNSIRQTINICLERLGIEEHIDLVLSNEDVYNPKPHPEIYWKTMSSFGVLPEQTVIFEDSIVGILAAKQSGASLVEVLNRSDLTIDKINHAIDTLSTPNSSWSDNSLNVLIPMAGLGTRFSDAGYEFPKPLVEVDGKPMIQAVVESLKIKANYIYVVQKEHYNKYNLYYLLNLITPGCEIVVIDGITEGAAVTALLAKDFIDNNKPLLMANSDQIIEWNPKDFIYDLTTKSADGGIATFKSVHPKWSYARLDSNGLVVEVAEKKPISDIATVGIYYWKHGSDFVKYAQQMIDNNIRVNNEFYVCPVFNEAIKDGKRIFTKDINKMWGVGTPEDLKQYLYEKRNS